MEKFFTQKFVLNYNFVLRIRILAYCFDLTKQNLQKNYLLLKMTLVKGVRCSVNTEKISV
ncbi:hypothetical protein BpHYR1_007293 [Brachionus plicatilis]|uniref:Uncharacterized protein n=1 Tax=Brachionus plicatilis TaxID=10195 RepID=A0A3M7R0E2_BRAPC|nr:hypothetical protein BpHYR1_007293 [Brachionus plicatilis]